MFGGFLMHCFLNWISTYSHSHSERGWRATVKINTTVLIPTGVSCWRDFKGPEQRCLLWKDIQCCWPAVRVWITDVRHHAIWYSLLYHTGGRDLFFCVCLRCRHVFRSCASAASCFPDTWWDFRRACHRLEPNCPPPTNLSDVNCANNAKSAWEDATCHDSSSSTSDTFF